MHELGERCPKCEVGLTYVHTDGRIYSRAIMVEIPDVYDGGLFWQCPDCGGRWHRWPEGTWQRRKAQEYVE